MKYTKKTPILKKCKICGNPFFTPRILHTCCSKKCAKINYLNYRNEYNKINKKTISEKLAKRYELKKGILLQKMQQYYLKNRKNRILKVKEYAIKNKNKTLIYKKNYKLRNKQNILFKLRNLMSRRLVLMLRRNGYTRKENNAEKLMGYTCIDLKKHLESQFTPEMSWGNYGSYWHIDHKIPLSFGKSYEELLELSQLDNLQPLEKTENYSKCNRHISGLFNFGGVLND